MEETKLGVIESRFADLIWANAPLSSGELVRLCGEELGWKKSTTYTVLKKLCCRGLFRNDGGTVTAAVSRGLWRRPSRDRSRRFSPPLPAGKNSRRRRSVSCRR